MEEPGERSPRELPEKEGEEVYGTAKAAQAVKDAATGVEETGGEEGRAMMQEAPGDAQPAQTGVICAQSTQSADKKQTPPKKTEKRATESSRRDDGKNGRENEKPVELRRAGGGGGLPSYILEEGEDLNTS